MFYDCNIIDVCRMSRTPIAEPLMDRPLGVTILAVLGALNGLAALALGVATLLGNQFVYTPGGYGPNRVALASLLGPLAVYAGWVVLLVGLALGAFGYGFFTLQPWARLTLLVVLAIVSLLTVGAIGWGVWRGEWGVVGSGLLKLALYAGLMWYLSVPSVRAAFVGSRGEVS